MDREWGNGKRMRKWTVNAEMDWESLKYVTFCRKMLKYSTFCCECRKILTYTLWGNDSGSNQVARKPHKLCQPASDKYHVWAKTRISKQEQSKLSMICHTCICIQEMLSSATMLYTREMIYDGKSNMNRKHLLGDINTPMRCLLNLQEKLWFAIFTGDADPEQSQGLAPGEPKKLQQKPRN